MAQSKGFFGKLFDFSFSESVAVQIVGVLYAIYVVLAGLFVFFVVLSSFSKGFASGLGALIGAPLIFLVYTIFIRIALESLVAQIRTSENTRVIAENTRRSGF